MPKYVLHYFNIRGRAEISRLIMVAGKIPFEDSRVQDRVSEWPTKKQDAPIGQLPYLEIDQLKLPQSLTIARYLAREADLAGKTNIEQAQADAVVDTIQDALYDYVKKVHLIQDSTEKALALGKFLADDLPRHVGNIEKLVNLYGEDGFAVGNSLTWADLYIFDFYSNFLDKVPEFKTNFHVVSQIIQTVKDNQLIAEYLRNRPVTEY